MAKEDNKQDLQKEIERTAKLFDVAKPGKSAPATTPATARPIIVGHASMIKHDPMVKEEEGESESDKPDINLPVKAHNAKKITPISLSSEGEKETIPVEASEMKTAEEKLSGESEDISNVTSASQTSTETAPEDDSSTENNNTDHKIDSQLVAEVVAEKKARQATSHTGNESDSSKSDAVVYESREADAESDAPGEKSTIPLEPDSSTNEVNIETAAEPSQPSAETPQDSAAQSPAKQAAVNNLVSEVTTKQDDKKQKEELASKQAEIEESIRKREFFVPIGQVSRRRTNRILIFSIFLILLLGAAGLNFAIDAELLDIGVNSLTDLL